MIHAYPREHSITPTALPYPLPSWDGVRLPEPWPGWKPDCRRSPLVGAAWPPLADGADFGRHPLRHLPRRG